MTTPHEPHDSCFTGDDPSQRDATSADRAPSAGAADFDMGSGDVASLREQVLELQDRALRAQADFDNYRKRARRDLDEQTRYAALPLLRDLLPVLDNLQRALSTLEADTESQQGLAAGVRMVATQFADVLSRHECCRIEAEGAEFDPASHEAIAQQPSPHQPHGTILHVSQQGYRLHERVVRPAQVIVSAGPANLAD